MKLRITERGFERVEFHDGYGECSIQESSAIGEQDGAYENPGSSFLWFGTRDRAHLSRALVAETIKRMQAWLDTGSLKIQGD